jgi:hypothetical protein
MRSQRLSRHYRREQAPWHEQNGEVFGSVVQDCTRVSKLEGQMNLGSSQGAVDYMQRILRLESDLFSEFPDYEGLLQRHGTC